MDIDAVESLCDEIKKLRHIIENAHLTDADSNVLSVALQKIERDKAELNCTVDAMFENRYYDMENYFEEKIDRLFQKLQNDYFIVKNLYVIAADRERESLLSYLEKM